MSNAYTQANSTERAHLIALVNRLSDEQLARPLSAGWTVSGVLAHLAFWDERAIVLLQKWQESGIAPSPNDIDVVNDASKPLCLALAPRTAANLAVATAIAIDQTIEKLDPAFMAEVETNGKTVRLDRANHRRGHLAEIEQALGLSA